MSESQALTNKKEIRKKMLEKREALTREEIERMSSLIVDRLWEKVECRQARVLLAYAPFRNEVDIGAFLKGWLAEKKSLLLPLTDWQRREIHPVVVERYPEELAPGRYGILEPPVEKHKIRWETEQIDLVLVPGVAFDCNGYRLGYGQGFYDRFLRQLSEKVSIIGLAYDFQVVDTVFPEDHDLRIPTIITEITEYREIVDQGRIFDVKSE